MMIRISMDEGAEIFIRNMLSGAKLKIFMVIALLCISAIVYSAATLPHTFRAGEKISADEVNENFAALKNRIDELEGLIARAEGAPVGAILAFAGTSERVPAGWYACDGREVPRFREGGTEFTELFQAIGVTWGVGDGTTTHTLPDLRGMFLRGANTVLHDAGERTDTYRDEDFAGRWWANEMQRNGEGVGSFEMDEYDEHTHLNQLFISPDVPYFDPSTVFSPENESGRIISSSSSSYLRYRSYTSNSGGKETRPKNAAVHFIIKH